MFFVLSVFNLSAYAGQGMYLRLESQLPAQLAVLKSECIDDPQSILSNETKYIEGINSGICFFKQNKISFNLYINDKFIQKYDIDVSANGSNLMPNGFIAIDGYQISAQLFPHYGPGTQDSILFHVQTQADHWQSDSTSEISDRMLNQVIMPGSHDSGTYGVNAGSFLTSDAESEYLNLASQIGFHSYIEGWTKTQKLSILEQLSLGIRYLDLRVCGKRLDGSQTDLQSNPYICHTLSSVMFQKIIDEVSEFLEQPNHEKEVILLDINHLYDINDNQFNEMTSYMQKKLGRYIASPQNFTTSSTYHDFWNEGKQLIVFIDRANAHDIFHDIYWANQDISSPWPDATETNILIQKMEENLSTRDPKKFFVLQTQKTPNTNTILSGFNIFKSDPRNALEFTGNYQLKVSDWIFKNKVNIWKNGNIMIQDFVNGMP